MSQPYTPLSTIRRAALACVAALVLAGHPVRAEEPAWTHGTALTGEPTYQQGFTHFDYVDPQAPKGGTVRLAVSTGFDTFNPILSKGNPAPGLGLLYDQLMESSLDELDTSSTYGLVAEAVRSPADHAWVEYRLDPAARWHDGTPITAEDVIWSFEKLREVNPSQGFYYRHVVKAEKVGERTVRFTFDAPGNRELPHIVGQVPVLPKAWWEGTDANGVKRDIAKGTLEPPLGSGPYRIKSFEPGRHIVYERVEDYWAKDHPVRVGTNNFGEIRYDVFLDSAVELEAFKGDQYDFREELSANVWSKAYDFPAVKDGRVVLEEFPSRASGRMQAYVPNLRREKFQDPRVRRALNLAYDFETTNQVVSAGLHKRIGSYFAGTDLAASGLPEGLELEILETVRDEVPPEVFTTPYENPVGGSPKKVRDNLRQAVKLFREAGYKLDGRRMVDANTGEQFTIEFIYFDRSAERGLLPYTKNLENIGVKTVLRLIDVPQYINRVQSRDFDMATLVWGQSLSPGNEQRDFWGSEAADRPQSRNYAGIKDPAVDKLIERIIYAKDREELVAATHALDRVLLWNHFVVPQFYSDVDRTARWDRFGRPQTLPEFSHGFPTIWWWDKDKAARVGGRG
ncbi:ABC transporter substrate-binding protein [Stappia taiwanensis]|uniref:ABC transporter substrate-binding protein n=1 Tax=Stappia taiwanensis TaxID=992267 RepID=A0A838Y1X2_9HYPH|nr:extracellular solute-binding protein [Stappia taiwanensis]MBA4613023.1 ABC transporter substrate-binding protein [Stappia taiwanensis]GGF01873.1 ABC transporter substrate-binding protein [Stappia taiwanensis]